MESVYAFANNQPTTLIDPSGERPIPRGRFAAAIWVSLFGTTRCFASAQAPMSADRYGNGCGPGGITAKLVPDRVPGVFDFRDPCDAHDRCYGQRWGTWRSSCDSSFHRNMNNTCPSSTIDLGHGACLSLNGCAEIPNPREGGCHAAADIYYRAVRDRGRDAFVKGQTGVIKDCRLKTRDACLKQIQRRADQ